MRAPFCRRLLLIAAALGFLSSASAQPSVTRRTLQSPGPRAYFLPTNSLPVKSPSPVTTATFVDPKTAKATAVVLLPMEKPLTAEEKAKREQKQLEFQRSQAESGRDFAQYELGMRYLKGEGVGQNMAEARKWITLSAAQNYTLAVRKLAELDAAGQTK